MSADSVIGLQTENRVSSETARVEDRVDARVTRDVRVGDRVAIPAGARALGSVMQVERGGKFKERARLGIRFHTLVLADGTRMPISTETILPRRRSAGQRQRGEDRRRRGRRRDPRRHPRRRQGRGNRRGAGAGAGTAAVMAGDRNAATLAAGTPMTVRILAPVTVTTDETNVGIGLGPGRTRAR